MNIISLKYLLFVAVVVGGYYLIPKRFQWGWLLAASYFFYLTAGVQFIGYLLFTTVTTFLCGRWLEKAGESLANKPELAALPAKERKKLIKKKKRGILTAGLLLNFGLLGIVKYADFVLENLNVFLVRAGKPEFGFLGIAAPLGLSFYIFQSTGYLIDIYRGKIKADRNLFRFALFVSYFPQIIQGPISRYQPLTEQLFEERSFDYTRVKFGAQRAMWGLFKKLVIADRAAMLVNEVFDNYVANGYEGFTIFVAGLICFFQVYADFSGGIDIVCGISEALGVNLTESFRHPFHSKSVAEFWQRWNITLGSWMRDYVFYPLALSKPFEKMSRRLRKSFGSTAAKIIPTSIASFLVFILVGLWHGASWKYVAYGLFNAVFVSTGTLLEPFYARCRQFFRVVPERFSFRLFQMIRTTLILTVGRFFSNANSMRDALAMLKRMVTVFNPWVLTDGYCQGGIYTLWLNEANFLLLVLVIVLLLAVDTMQEKGIHLREALARQGIVFRWIVYFLAIFSIIIFGAYGSDFDASAFVYQGF